MNLHQREKPDDSARSVALQMKYKSKKIYIYFIADEIQIRFFSRDFKLCNLLVFPLNKKEVKEGDGDKRKIF